MTVILTQEQILTLFDLTLRHPGSVRLDSAANPPSERERLPEGPVLAAFTAAESVICEDGTAEDLAGWTPFDADAEQLPDGTWGRTAA